PVVAVVGPCPARAGPGLSRRLCRKSESAQVNVRHRGAAADVRATVCGGGVKTGGAAASKARPALVGAVRGLEKAQRFQPVNASNGPGRATKSLIPVPGEDKLIPESRNRDPAGTH